MTKIIKGRKGCGSQLSPTEVAVEKGENALTSRHGKEHSLEPRGTQEKDTSAARLYPELSEHRANSSQAPAAHTPVPGAHGRILINRLLKHV